MRLERQGEADPIIDVMNEYGLCSLLRRGTKTWSDGTYDTTIDLVLASGEMRDAMLQCKVMATDHGSDHCAIDTVFDVSVPSYRSSREASAQECAVERDQGENRDNAGDRPVRRYSPAENRSTNGGSIGSSPSPNAQGPTIAAFEEVVDHGSHTAAWYLHVLEEPCPVRTASRNDAEPIWKSRRRAQRSSTTKRSDNRRRNTGTSFWPTTTTSGRRRSI